MRFVSLLITASLVAGISACSRKAPVATAPRAADAAAAAGTAGAATAGAAAEGAAAPAPANPNLPGYVRPEGAVATVNGHDIPAEKFNAEFDKLVGGGTRVPADRVQRIARNILQKLVEHELREQAIVNEHIELTEPEFEEAFKEYQSRYVDAEGHFAEAQMQTDLQRAHQTIDEIKAQIREQRLARKLVEKTMKIEISEADIKAFYDQNPSAWVEPPSREVRPIIVRVATEATTAERKAAEDKAQEASKALKKGGDFEQIALQFGEQPLPPIHLTRGSQELELEQAAFAMKVGEVSAPIKTRWGYYVLRLIEKNEQRTRPFVEVHDEIRKTLASRRFYLEDRRMVQELRKKADIVDKLPF